MESIGQKLGSYTIPLNTIFRLIFSTFVHKRVYFSSISRNICKSIPGFVQKIFFIDFSNERPEKLIGRLLALLQPSDDYHYQIFNTSNSVNRFLSIYSTNN